jgi:uncharacterized protein (DUF2141 family)
MRRNILLSSFLTAFLAAFLIGAGIMSVLAQTKVVPILEMKAGGLLGGVLNGKYLDAKATAAKMKGAEHYELFTMMGHEEGEMTGKKPEPGGDVCTDFYTVELDQEADYGVALGGSYKWNPVPRVPKELSLTNKAYIKIASDFLRTKNIVASNVKLTQLYSVDLDGDGKQEIILSATRYSGGQLSSAKINDYSFTIVRTVAAGKAKNIEIGGEYIKKGFDFGAPNTYFVSAVLDLNGDGKMEIVENWSYYEGTGSFALEFKDGKATEIKALDAGCGV